MSRSITQILEFCAQNKVNQFLYCYLFYREMLYALLQLFTTCERVFLYI